MGKFTEQGKKFEIFSPDFNYKVKLLFAVKFDRDNEDGIVPDTLIYFCKAHETVYRIVLSENKFFSSKYILDEDDLEDIIGIGIGTEITVDDLDEMFGNWEEYCKKLKPLTDDNFYDLYQEAPELQAPMPDEESEEDFFDSAIRKLNGDTSIKNAELAGKMEHLNYLIDEDNEQQILLLLETIIDKFSPKDTLQHAMYTATRTKEELEARIDQILADAEDAVIGSELLAYLDSAITNIELTEASKKNDELTKEHKDAGGEGHIKQVNRGDVYWCTLTSGVGHEMSGKRTVLVISNSLQNKNGNTVNVLAMDGAVTREKYQVAITDSDLQKGELPDEKNSVAVTITSILTVDKARLENWQCKVKYNKMKDINVRLFTQLGMSLDGLKDEDGNFRVL